MSKKTITIDYDLYHEELEDEKKEGFNEGYEEGEKTMKKYFIEAMIDPENFFGDDWKEAFLAEFPESKPLIDALFKSKFYKEKKS